MRVRAVLFDFYGTLAVEDGPTFADLVEAHGGRNDWEVHARWTLDGHEHVEASASRDAYEAFMGPRRRSMLAELGLDDDAVESFVAATYAGQRSFRLYDDVLPTLDRLRELDLRVAVCSNWDWDLPDIVAAVGLDGRFDAVVTSARAGARKPHRRIFDVTLDALGVTADGAVFVGDTVAADVDGPLALGMRPVHVWRWAGPRPALPPGVAAVDSLTELEALL